MKSAEWVHMVELDFNRVGELVALENEIFSLPWGVKEYMTFFLQDCSLGFGAQKGSALVGFITCFSPPGELHILNVAVKKEQRRQKIGSFLIQTAFSRFREMQGKGSVFLEVRPSNGKAVALYQSFGFYRIAIREKYYADNNEDAWVMRLDL